MGRGLAVVVLVPFLRGAFEAGRLGVPVDGAPAAPVIWRQVEVPTSITLKILHDITTLLNARRREAEIVGIDPLPKDVTPDLKTYLDTRAEPPAEAD